ncbi:MAG: YfgM family protein [Gammaproteobacteria bacterium]
MDEFLSEKEQVEVLRRWWSENGRWIIGGLVVGAAVLFGWRAWNHHLATQAEAASTIYGELLTAVDAGKLDEAASLREDLARDFARTPYTTLSGLALARLHAEAGEAEAAAQALTDVLAATDDEELKHIARLRLARVRLQQDQPDAAAEALTGAKEGRFAPLYAHVRGDIFVAESNLAAARDAYRKALAGGEPGVVDRNLVQMKLDALGGSADEPEPAATEAAQ